MGETKMLVAISDYLIFGGILAFLNGLLVAYTSERIGRKTACIICIYMITFIFAYPGWIDYAVSIGVLNYSTLYPLLPIEDAHLVYVTSTIKIEIPMYLVYSLTLSLASVIGLTIPMLKGMLLFALLLSLSATSMVLGIFMSAISVLSLLQLEIFGTLCLLVGIFSWWGQRVSRTIASKAKKYCEFIEMKGEVTAEDIMHEFRIKDKRDFARVIQKMLDEHQVILSEREGKIWLSINLARKSQNNLHTNGNTN